jgi:hypothetical protein
MTPSEATARSPVHLDTADNDELSDNSEVVITQSLSVCCLRTNYQHS